MYLLKITNETKSDAHNMVFIGGIFKAYPYMFISSPDQQLYVTLSCLLWENIMLYLSSNIRV